MALADGVSFVAASAGTVTFVFSAARNSYLTLAQAQSAAEIVDGQTVSYLAVDSVAAPNQREWGHGTYSLSGNSVARTTVLGTMNGATPGSGTPLNFSVAPTVFLTALAEDFSNLVGPIYNSNYRYVQPVAAATVVLNNADYQVVVDPAGVLSSLTIEMCPAPLDGQIVEFTVSQSLSGLSFLPNAGQSVVNAPNALSFGALCRAVYRVADTTWYFSYSVPYIITNTNLTFYVASTGSDSNPGTLASPFATLGRAIFVVGLYNYQNTYSWTIQIADGTYTESGNNWYTPTAAVNLPLLGGHIIGHPSVPANVVFNNLSHGITHNGPYELFVEGIQFQNAGLMSFLFLAGGGGAGVSVNGSGCGIIYGSFNVVTNNAGFGYIFEAGAGAVIDDGSSTATATNISISGTHAPFGSILSGDAACILNCDGGVSSLNFSGAWATAVNWIFLTGGAQLFFSPSAVTGVVSAALGSAFSSAFVTTNNGSATDFPGVTAINGPNNFVDSTAVWSNFTTTAYVAAPESVYGAPVAGVPSWTGSWDDTNGVVYMAASDGTNSFYTSLSTKYKVSAPLSAGTVTSSVGLRSNILNPAGTLATLTVNLPTGIKDGYTTRVSTSQTITAITFATTDSSAIVGAPTTLLASSAVQFLFDAAAGPNGTWYIN